MTRPLDWLRRRLGGEAGPSDGRCRVTFRDARPPHTLRHLLEAEVTTLFATTVEDDRLVMRATPVVNGALYRWTVTHDATDTDGHTYTVGIVLDLDAVPAEHRAAHLRSFPGWVGLWLRHFETDASPPARHHDATRHAQARQTAVADAGALDTVEAVQQAIVAAMHAGRTFSTAHKEGGTILRWQAGRFTRADYGESNEHQTFASEAEFLAFLRRFFAWEVTSRSGKRALSELEAWTLILRRMH